MAAELEPAPLADAVAPGTQAGEPLPWSSLSNEQQQLLQSRANDWATLPPARQHALARGAERWLNMPPAERSRTT